MKDKIVHHIRRISKKSKMNDENYLQKIINSSIDYFYELINVGYSHFLSYKIVIRKSKHLINEIQKTQNYKHNTTLYLIGILLAATNYVLFFLLNRNISHIFIFDCFVIIAIFLFYLFLFKNNINKLFKDKLKKFLVLTISNILIYYLLTTILKLNFYIVISILLALSNIIWCINQKKGGNILLVTIPSLLFFIFVSYNNIFKINNINLLLIIMVSSFFYFFINVNFKYLHNLYLFILTIIFIVVINMYRPFIEIVYLYVLIYALLSFLIIKRVSKIITREDYKTIYKLFLFALIFIYCLDIGIGIAKDIETSLISNDEFISFILFIEITELIYAFNISFFSFSDEIKLKELINSTY